MDDSIAYAMEQYINIYVWDQIISCLDTFTRRFVATLVSKRWQMVARRMDHKIVKCDQCLAAGNGAGGSMWRWRWVVPHPTHRSYALQLTRQHKCILYSIEEFRAKLCKEGNAKLLRALHNKHAKYSYYKCIDHAVQYGRVNAMKFFQEIGIALGRPQEDDIYTCYAARNGAFNTLQWFNSQGLCPNDRQLSEYAAKGGHVHILQWLKDNDFEIDARIAEHAAEYGKKNVIIWAALNGYHIDVRAICESAVREENYDICDIFGINLLTTSMYMPSKSEYYASPSSATNGTKVNNCKMMLHQAIWNEDISSVEYLIKCGMQYPPLHTVKIRTRMMLLYLIKKGALIDIDACIASEYWKWAAHDLIPYVKKYAARHHR